MDKSDDKLNISVVLALPESQHIIELSVEPGCSARQAVLLAQKSGLNFDNSPVQAENAPLGVFGRAVEGSYVLQAGDRVELYRALEQDPKEWRRQRAQSGG